MTETENRSYPLIPLRNLLISPNSVVPLLIGRQASKQAVELAMGTDKAIFCVTQRSNNESEVDPKTRDLYRIGTLCTILQMFKLPDGNYRILVHGEARARAKRYHNTDLCMQAAIEIHEFPPPAENIEIQATLRSFERYLKDYIRLNRSLPEETIQTLNDLSGMYDFFYFGLGNIDLPYKKKQKIYEKDSIIAAIQMLYEFLSQEIEILELENNIESKVKKKLSKLQKEYYLHEQLKIIHEELGIAESDKDDIISLKKRISEANLSPEASKKAKEEIKKLINTSRHSQEYGVIYGYLNWLLDMPWKEVEKADFDLNVAQEILNNDHYGLLKVKDRILEFLAVMKLTKKVRGQILCFVGPPGVGKTSLGKSIAHAVNRKFVRLSLGGVRDEAEIRGHRRTYVGALPGVIMQSMKKAETRNPLIMMDEVDKMSVDFRGDPSSALLEVLDPEQNGQFRDHYLDFGYDLSDVLFITTANTLASVPQPLIDRMEIIEIPGYTEIEKLNIATRHLLPRTIEDHETKGKIKINIKEDVIKKIISSYTREAGVRSLERKIATIIRKIIKQYIQGDVKKSKTVSKKELASYLGVEKHLYSEINSAPKIGVVTGLAWTPTGGDTLEIEVLKMPGEGKLELTGKLGDVMKESAQAAYSLARNMAADYNIPADFNKKYDLHIHVPEGAIPKDGPSAGVTMLTAIISALSERAVDNKLAMTGEITLSGKILAIGGLPEKLIAAKRAGVKRVLVPALNAPHLTEVADEIKDGLEIVLVGHVSEVLAQAII